MLLKREFDGLSMLSLALTFGGANGYNESAGE
jgi:hypothetical protein